jgi:hypothetical protein
MQLIAGQRVTDQTLVYLGPYYADYKMAGNVKHELSDDNLSPAVDYRFEGQGTRAGLNANVEVQLGKLSSSHFTFAAGYSKTTWTNAEDQNNLDLGVSLNFDL